MKKITVVYAYEDLELNAMFDKVRQDQWLMLEVKAQQDGLAHQPETLKQYQVQVLHPITSTLQALISYCHQRYQRMADIAIVGAMRKETQKREDELTVKANAAERRHVVLLDECKVLKAKLKKRMPWLLRVGLPVAFGILEGGLVFLALQSAAISLFTAFFISAGIGLGSAVGLHLGADYIKRAENKQQGRRRHIFILGLAFVVAAALGLWRASMSEEAAAINASLSQTSTAGTATNQYFFIVLFTVSFVLFAIALSLKIKAWMSDEEKKMRQEYKDKAQEAELAQAECAALRTEAARVHAEALKASADVIRKQEYAKAFERRVVDLADELQDFYESENLSHRPQGGCPEFFGQPKIWALTLYFQDLFNPKKD